MANKGKTKKWFQRQSNDPYVQQAKAQGYRSRAAFKLLEINQKHKILRNSMSVLDLGAAPGGWSQVAMQLVGELGQVCAIDLLPMAAIEGVEVLQGDVQEDKVFAQLVEQHPFGYDLVISDMAPNLTGNSTTDQLRAIALAELALDLTVRILKADGVFLIKVFQGRGFEQYVKQLRQFFKKVVICKPKSSRAESQEVYCLAKGYTVSNE